MRSKNLQNGQTFVKKQCTFPFMVYGFLLMYARDTSKKIRATWQSKGKSGEHLPTIPPYGYMKSPEDKKKWIVDEEAAAVVQKFVAYANERYLVIQTKYRSLCFLLTSTARCHNH